MSTLTQGICADANSASPLSCGQCKTCERKGVPVFLLREVMTAEGLISTDGQWSYGERIDEQGKKHAEERDKEADLHFMKEAPHGQYPTPLCRAMDGTKRRKRVLRTGQVYVFLEPRQGGAITVEGYRVSEQGWMRYFNPYEPQEAVPFELSTACLTDNHDVKASFIGVDVVTYKMAHIAFAHDVWPASVLDGYKEKVKKGELKRFTTLDLNAIAQGQNPVEPQGVLKHNDISYLTDEQDGVLEYAYDSKLKIYSQHGYVFKEYETKVATEDYVNDTLNKLGIEGIAAVTLKDPVGEVLELNFLRMLTYSDLQIWQESDQRAYMYTTALEVEKVRNDLRLKFAKREVTKHLYPATTGTIGNDLLGTPMYSEEQVRQYFNTDAQADERLAESCNLNECNLFVVNFVGWSNVYLRTVNKLTSFYVQAIEQSDECLFLYVAEHDYARGNDLCVSDEASVDAYVNMLAAALEGGVTDAALYVENNVEVYFTKESLEQTPAIDFWRRLLDKDCTLVLEALTRRNSALQAMFNEVAEQEIVLEQSESLRDVETKISEEAQQESDKAKLVNMFGLYKEVFSGLDKFADTQAIDSLLNTSLSALQRVEAQDAIRRILNPESARSRVRELRYSVLLYKGRPFLYSLTDLTFAEYDELVTELMVAMNEEAAREYLAREREHNRRNNRTPSVREANSKPMNPRLSNRLIEMGMMHEIQISPLDLPPEIFRIEDKAQFRAALKDAIDVHVENNKARLLSDLPIVHNQDVPNIPMRRLLQRLMPSVTRPDPHALIASGEGSVSAINRIGRGKLALAGLDVISFYFLYQSLQSGLKDIDKKLGQDQTVAVLSVYASMTGLLSAGMGLASFSIESVLAVTNRSSVVGLRAVAAASAETLGKRIAPILGMLSGTTEALMYFAKASNAASRFENPDVVRHLNYIGVNKLVLSTAALMMLCTPLLPLAFAVTILSLAVGLVLDEYVSFHQRTPLEDWLDRCCFGLGRLQSLTDKTNDETFLYKWEHYEYQSSAVNGLIAALLGVQPYLEAKYANHYLPNMAGTFGSSMVIEALRLEMKADLNGFNYGESVSAYNFVLSIQTRRDEDILIHEEFGPSFAISNVERISTDGMRYPRGRPELGQTIKELGVNGQGVVDIPLPPVWIAGGFSNHRPTAENTLLHYTSFVDIDREDIVSITFHLKYWHNVIKEPGLLSEVLIREVHRVYGVV